MIELRPAGVTLETRAQPRILLLNHWVRFSDKFPEQLKHVKGKTMRVVRQQQVTYELSYTLKEACYKDINLSNEDTGVKLYPDSSEIVYEMLIALKPGNWYFIPYFPADQPIYRLDYPTMTPLVSDAALKFLGTVRPYDSPYLDEPGFAAWGAANFRLYLVFELKPIILRVVADDSVDYSKCTLEFLVNRCRVEEGTPPENVSPKPILYLDEIRDMG